MKNKGFRCNRAFGSVSRWARGCCYTELGGNDLYWPSCHPKHECKGNEAETWKYLRKAHSPWTQLFAFCAVVSFGVGLQYLDGLLFPQNGLEEAWVQLALAAAGVAASLFGGAKSAAAARKAQREQEREKAKEDALLTRKRNESYADTAAGQRLLTNAREAAKEIWKREHGRMLVGGGTDAAAAQAKEQGNKLIGNTLSNMAAQDTARQDKADYAQIESDRRHAQIMSGYEMQRANAINTAASQASNAMMSAAGSLDNGGALAKNTGQISTDVKNSIKPTLTQDAWEEEMKRVRGQW